MSETKIKLNMVQIAFVMEMLEIENASDAIKRFAQIMAEEKLSPREMSKVIDIIMSRAK